MRTLIVCLTLLPTTLWSLTYHCEAPGRAFDVEVTQLACLIDGKALPKLSERPVICSLGGPDRQVMTLGADRSFTFRDSAGNEVLTGACRLG